MMPNKSPEPLAFAVPLSRFTVFGPTWLSFLR